MDSKDFKNLTKDELTLEEKIAIECLKSIKDPFVMITLNDVKEDLNISDSSAYKLFRRKDFPSVNIGKKNQIMLLSYILWKMKRQV